MIVSLIAALATNRVIGRDGAMPWHIAADLRHFRALTMGKPIVMGRKTYAAIGRPLPGRPNIVLTRDRDFAPPGVETCRTLDAALAAAETRADALGVDEIMIVGGGDVYAQALPLARRLYLTLVDACPEGDAYFPDYDPADWTETAREDHPAMGGLPAFRFMTLERRGAIPPPTRSARPTRRR